MEVNENERMNKNSIQVKKREPQGQVIKETFLKHPNDQTLSKNSWYMEMRK